MNLIKISMDVNYVHIIWFDFILFTSFDRHPSFIGNIELIVDFIDLVLGFLYLCSLDFNVLFIDFCLSIEKSDGLSNHNVLTFG